MSNSIQLSRQRLGTVINSQSKKQEKKANICIDYLKTILQRDLIESNEHINMQLVHRKYLGGKRIFNLFHPNKDINIFYNESELESIRKMSIRPDLGLLYITFDIHRNGEECKISLPLLAGELKRQGTNDRRLANQLLPQNMGNAIERSSKNITWFKEMFRDVDRNFYVIFTEGCDFREGSSLLSRLIAHTNMEFPNRRVFNREGNIITNVLDSRYHLSSYARDVPWESFEMLCVFYEIVYQMLTYYSSSIPELNVSNIKRGKFLNKKRANLFLDIIDREEQERIKAAANAEKILVSIWKDFKVKAKAKGETLYKPDAQKLITKLRPCIPEKLKEVLLRY